MLNFSFSLWVDRKYVDKLVVCKQISFRSAYVKNFPLLSCGMSASNVYYARRCIYMRRMWLLLRFLPYYASRALQLVKKKNNQWQFPFLLKPNIVSFILFLLFPLLRQMETFPFIRFLSLSMYSIDDFSK